MNIPEHRKAIDSLDAKIVRILNERTRHVLEIGAIKMRAGEEIYAPHRELAVLRRLCAKNKGPITNESLRAIYREIMSSALSLEKTMTIAYLGPEATFTHQAAIHRFGASLNYSAVKTISDVFTEVSRNRADYGVVPVENSTEGVVTHTLDMFIESDLKIVAQIILPVQHCLLANCTRAQIKKAWDKAQIAQTVLTAPADAIVTDTNGAVGETVTPATTVVSLIPNGELEIKLNVSEDNIVGVKTGQSAQISLDAFPTGTTWPGKVVSIDPAQTTVGGAVYYQATILFDKPDPSVKPGMTANVLIETGSATSTLFVPASAIQANGTSTIVQIYQDGKVTNQNVVTGLKSQNGMIEITSGVTEGQQVITGGQ